MISSSDHVIEHTPLVFTFELLQSYLLDLMTISVLLSSNSCPVYSKVLMGTKEAFVFL